MGNLEKGLGKSCCKRGKFRPNINRSLIHKRKDHIGPELPNLKRAGVYIATAPHWFPIKEPQAKLHPVLFVRFFFSKNTAIKSEVFSCKTLTLTPWKSTFAYLILPFSLWNAMAQLHQAGEHNQQQRAGAAVAPAPVSASHASTRASAGVWGSECLYGHNPAAPGGISVSVPEGEGAEQCKKIPLPWIFMWIFKHAWCVLACPLCSLWLNAPANEFLIGRKSILWWERQVWCYYLLLASHCTWELYHKTNELSATDTTSAPRRLSANGREEKMLVRELPWS